MNRSFQIFKTRFQMNLKFNLPPSKAILLERMSADLRVIPSQLREIPPHPRGGGWGDVCNNPADHFFWTDKSEKRRVCFPTYRRQYLKVQTY